MAEETKTLAWRLIVQTQGIEENTRKAAQSLAKVETAAQKAQSLLKEFGVVLRVAALAKIAQEVIEIADAYTALTNTLKSSTESAAELHTVQMELIASSHENATTVEQTVEAFNRMHDATEGLGLSQQEVIDLTKTVTQTMRLSGQSAEQAQAGLSKFAVALENGGMTARDFKSALKDSRELLNALSAGLGVSVKDLRRLAEEGRLSSDVLVKGLQQAADAVQNKINNATPTIADAWDSAKSSFKAMIGEFNAGLGVTQSLAEVLRSIGGFFSDVATKAQFMGIAVKFALKTVEIEIATFIDLTIENFIRMGIGFNRALNDIMTGAGLFGQGFSKAIDKQQADSDQRWREIIERKKKFTEDFVAATNAQAEALNATNIGSKGTATGITSTADQFKALESLGLALTALKNRAFDAQDEIKALRLEMQAGKPAADALRSQLTAAQQARELTAQMEQAFNKANQPLTEGLRAGIDMFVQSAVKATTEAKQMAEAWGIVNNAMNGAMTETERAEKQTKDLTDALGRLKNELPKTSTNLRLIDQAMKDIKDNANKAQRSLEDALGEIGEQTAAAKDEMRALNIEMSQGKDAADQFRAQVEAAKQARDLNRTTQENFKKAGKTFGSDVTDGITDATKALVDQNETLRRNREAWSLVEGAINNGMTETERAAKAVEELRRAMQTLEDQGHVFSPEEKMHFDKTVKDIEDSADIVAQAWKEAGQSMTDSVVDFLADGEFNFRRFAQTAIREIGRIIIRMLVLKAIESATSLSSSGSVTPSTANPDLIWTAKGGAFNHGRLVPMASGGVISTPTMFPMAGGNTGVMGEAGPEAVMPLARLSSGKLGVGAQPSNIQVVNNTGVQANARIERTANRTSIILEAAQLGANIAEERIMRSMRSGYGSTSAALQSTYGLRRRA